MALTNTTREGLTRMQAYARKFIQSNSTTKNEATMYMIDELTAADDYIERLLADDLSQDMKDTRQRELENAGLCKRCGDADPQCVCYSR